MVYDGKQDDPGDAYREGEDVAAEEYFSPPAPRVDPWSERHLADSPVRGVAQVPPLPPQKPAEPSPEPQMPVYPPGPPPSAYPAVPEQPPVYRTYTDGQPAPYSTQDPYATQAPYTPREPTAAPYRAQDPHPAQDPYPEQAQARPAAPQVGPNEFAAPPTAADFAARRSHRPEQPPAVMGVQGLLRKLTFGKVAPQPSHREIEHRQAVASVRRNFGGLRQITVVNPKGGAGKTVAVLMVAMTFGQQRGGYVLSWDNNETQGTLGMRAQQDFHHRTVRDLMAELGSFAGDAGRVGDLSRYVRSQGEAMFDVLASDESATAGEMLTAQAFRDLREVVSRFYKLIVVDTGNNVRAENWQAAIEDTDQLVVPMSARGDSAETAARMLDHLDQTGRSELVRRAVSVISMPASTKGTDLAAIRNHFSARTRAVLIAPYEPLLDSGEPIQYGQISARSREAWLSIAAAISEGL
jgi:MinD-like ATPase involved in chromosome partitioning or flagellar assembly